MVPTSFLGGHLEKCQLMAWSNGLAIWHGLPDIRHNKVLLNDYMSAFSFWSFYFFILMRREWVIRLVVIIRRFLTVWVTAYMCAPMKDIGHSGIRAWYPPGALSQPHYQWAILAPHILKLIMTNSQPFWIWSSWNCSGHLPPWNSTFCFLVPVVVSSYLAWFARY